MLHGPFRVALLVLTSCVLLVRSARCDEIKVEKDVVYGHGGDVALKLDVAVPEGDGPFPAIVFIHGGGWYQGDRQSYLDDVMEAARRGYVAATISYRLMTFDEAKKESTTAMTIFPAQVHDVKAAIRWLRANAKTYHVDPDRIGVTGGSAGGHLSLMLGLTDSDAKHEGEGGNPDQSSRVQAVVNYFGPTEMASCYEKSVVPWIFRLFLGGTPEEASETYRRASPITYASDDDPPVLTLHGDRDTLVPLDQATMLNDRMKQVGADHTLLVIEGAGHGFGGEHREQAMNAMWDFFDAHLKM